MTTEKQYFVKYKGLAHVHNRWEPESQLVTEAPLLLVKFNKKDQVFMFKVNFEVNFYCYVNQTLWLSC